MHTWYMFTYLGMHITIAPPIYEKDLTTYGTYASSRARAARIAANPSTAVPTLMQRTTSNTKSELVVSEVC